MMQVASTTPAAVSMERETLLAVSVLGELDLDPTWY